MSKMPGFIETEARIGKDRSLLKSNLFQPFWQDEDALAFFDVRGTFSDQHTQEGNYGIGFRKKSEDSLWGIYSYYDHMRSEANNTFHQFTLGAEYSTRRWAYRVNGYLPYDQKKRLAKKSYTSDRLTYEGINIFIIEELFEKYERPLHGMDFEAEIIKEISVNTATSLRFGGFIFDNEDVKSMYGPMASAEYTVFDPFHLKGYQIKLGIEGRYDNKRHGNYSGYIGLQIPLGAKPKLYKRGDVYSLRKRMRTPVRRGVDIMLQSTPTEVTQMQRIIPDNYDKAVFYTKQASTDEGSELAPTTLGDGISKGSKTILVGKHGGNLAGEYELMPDQLLVTDGTPVAINYTKNGQQTYLVEQFGDGMTAAPTMLDSIGGNNTPILALASNTGVIGINFEQSTTDDIIEIIGTENVLLKDVGISGNDAARYGIYAAGDVNNLQINTVSIDDISSSGMYFGGALSNTVIDNVALNHIDSFGMRFFGSVNSTEIKNTTFNDVDKDNIDFEAGGDNILIQNVQIDNVFEDGSWDGIFFSGAAYTNIQMLDLRFSEVRGTTIHSSNSATMDNITISHYSSSNENDPQKKENKIRFDAGATNVVINNLAMDPSNGPDDPAGTAIVTGSVQPCGIDYDEVTTIGRFEITNCDISNP